MDGDLEGGVDFAMDFPDSVLTALLTTGVLCHVRTLRFFQQSE